MQIFTKNLTGKTITLVVDDSIEIGPRQANGTFLVRTGGQEVFAVSAVLAVNGVSIHLSPPA